MSETGQFQSNMKQYQMPDALKKKKAGDTTTTGNNTGGKNETGKRSDLP